MSIVIEKAVPTDAEAVLAYLKQVGGETDDLTFGAEGLPFSVEAEAAFIASQENSSDSVMLLAREGGRIVGNASLSRLPRRMSHRSEVAVSVAKAYWSKGVGSRLMEELISFAKENGIAVIDLQVRCDNERAIRLYEKYGFQKLCTYPAFFRIEGEDVDFYYMCLRL